MQSRSILFRTRRRAAHQSRQGHTQWSPTLEALEDRYLLSYSIISLGTTQGFQSSIGAAINHAGQAVGTEVAYAGGAYTQHAFLYRNGTLTDLGTLAGDHSFAYAINNAGQVVGMNTAGHAFLYSDGTLTDLGTLGGYQSVAYGINDAGQVVGEADAVPSNSPHAFLYQDGVLRDLGTLGGSFSRAWAINDAGQVAGDSRLVNEVSHAFLYQDGVMTDLGTLVGDNSEALCEAYAINDRGQVVGTSATSTDLYPVYHAFLYRNGVMTDLGALGGRDSYSVANGINDAGQVVGYSITPGDGTHAFLYRDGTMTDLNSLLPPDSGWVLDEALGINARGQIVGEGLYQGRYQAFLMTPHAYRPHGFTKGPFALGGDAAAPEAWSTSSSAAPLVAAEPGRHLPLSPEPDGSEGRTTSPAALGWHHAPQAEGIQPHDVWFGSLDRGISDLWSA
jgi:probable HAF family extracellular repeat protein